MRLDASIALQPQGDPPMRRPWRVAALAALTLALALPAIPAAAQVADGVTVYVDDDATASASSCDGSDPAPTTIQGAVDSVGRNSTIWVCPGTYVGQVLVQGAAKNGITVRAVDKWTAVLKPPAVESLTFLMSIENADKVTIRNLVLRFPGRRFPCHRVESAIQTRDAVKTRILANRLIAKGPGTYDCGFRWGVRVQGGNSERPQSATIAWNLIQDFRQYAIDLCATGPSRIHGNSIRFFHVSEPYIGRSSGKGIYGNSGSACGPGPIVITDNVITSPDTAQVTTNVLTEAMEIQCCVTELSGNVARRVQVGFLVSARDQATVVEDNVLIGTLLDPKPFSRGIRALAPDFPIVVRNNTVRSFGQGVNLEQDAGSTIADNDLAANTQPCIDSSGQTNTWTNNLGCPAGPVIAP
jgi:hypothetical protein